MAARTDKELDHEFRMRQVQAFSTRWQSCVNFLCVAALCLCVYFSVRELAGKQTFADLGFKAVADLKANQWFGLALPWGGWVLTTGWAIGERRLRKRHIDRVSSENSEMQKMLDPGRRSSSLSKKGETSPEDF